jgi:hypothetical protein
MPKTQAKRGMSPRELDALRKRYVAEQKQADSASKWKLANDIVSGINDIVGRGVIAPILGIPGDINQAIYDAGAFVNNKIKDVEVATGMVKQPRYVQPSKGNAYLGSEDIGNRMQQAGLVSSERRPMTELAASLISPSAAAKSVLNAPKTAMNALRMVENLEAPSRGVRNTQGMYIPRGQMGAIDLGVAEAPQAKAANIVKIKDIRPAKENLYDVMNANFIGGKIIGDRTVPIDSLFGGIGNEIGDIRRVNNLADKISSPNGYIERLIVDDAGNVIEGQHRLDALRKIGVNDVPVTVIRDSKKDFPSAIVEKAIQESQPMRSDNVNQLLSYISNALADEGGDMTKLMQYEPPKGYEAAWKAGIDALKNNTQR